jgi:RNA polymerase sigma factor (sigma-70 family)
MMMTGVQAERLQRAETSVFEAFFTATFPKARAMASRLAGPALGEDLAIEGLARAYARWKSVSAMEYPEAWVMRVVTNAALDELRCKRVVLPVITIRDISADLVLRDNVVEALRTLTRRQQEVVVLRYIVDLPEAEVARILGMGTGSVKTHLHRAIPRLRSYLSKGMEGRT